MPAINKKLGYLRMICFNLLAMAISMVWSMNIIFMPLFITSRIAVSAFKIGFLVSLASIASLSFSPLIGHFSDRLNTPLGRRYPIIIVGTILAIVFLIVLPQLSSYASIALVAFFLYAAVAGMETSFYALIPEIIPKLKLGREVSILSIFRASGSIFIIFSGSLIWNLNHAYLFYIIAVIILLSSAVTLSEVRRHLCQEVKVEKCNTKSLVLHACLIEIWRDLKGKRDILNFYVAQFFWSFGLAAIFPFIFVYLNKQYGLEIGKLYKWVPGVGLISFLIVLSAGFLTDRWGYKKTLTLGVVLLSLFMPLNLIRGESIQVLFRLGLTTIPVLIILSQAPAYLSHLIPAGREGEFFGYDIFSITLAQIPAAWVSGLMIDRFGYPIMFCLASIGAAASMVYILWYGISKKKSQPLSAGRPVGLKIM